MNKKNRPLQAANSDIRVSDVTPLTKSLQAPKRTPKKHRARVYIDWPPESPDNQYHLNK